MELDGAFASWRQAVVRLVFSIENSLLISNFLRLYLFLIYFFLNYFCGSFNIGTAALSNLFALFRPIYMLLESVQQREGFHADDCCHPLKCFASIRITAYSSV
jgi:hypothetical protein